MKNPFKWILVTILIGIVVWMYVSSVSREIAENINKSIDGCYVER